MFWPYKGVFDCFKRSTPFFEVVCWLDNLLYIKCAWDFNFAQIMEEEDFLSKRPVEIESGSKEISFCSTGASPTLGISFWDSRPQCRGDQAGKGPRQDGRRPREAARLRRGQLRGSAPSGRLGGWCPGRSAGSAPEEERNRTCTLSSVRCFLRGLLWFLFISDVDKTEFIWQKRASWFTISSVCV